MKDIRLDLNDKHDMTLTGTDLTLVSDLDYILQKLSVRLLFFFGEWYLDTSVGVRFYEHILIKNPNIALIDSLLKGVILGTDGILEIVSYKSTFDNAARSLTIETEIRTTYGEAYFKETI
jgi:hypothetical protein